MKRRLTLFLVGAAVTAACLPGRASASPQDAGAFVTQGRALLEKREFAKARDAFLSAVAKDGKSVDARRGAAEAMLGLNRCDDAVLQAFAGLELVGDADAGLWLLAARAYLQKGETLPADQVDAIKESFADAKAKAAESLKRDPANLLATVILAKACRLSQDYDRAAQILDAALAKDPRSFELLFERGMYCLKAAKYALAVEAFTKAVESDPESGEARYHQGIAYAWVQQYDDAYASFAKAAVLDPNNTRSIKALLKQTGKSDALKLKWLREILKAKPDHAWAHAYLAYYLAYGKDEAGAMTESKAAMAAQKSNPDLQAWHGQVLEILGKAEEARTWYRKAIENDTTLPLAWSKLTEFALDPRSPAKQDERKAYIEFMGKTAKADGLFWNNAGLIYRDVIKDPRKALDAYLKASELSPTDQGIQNDTGLIYLYHGKAIGEDPRKALPYFENTLRLVREENQPAEMGYRDTLENLAHYYMEVEKNPERALEYAEARNDPDFLASLPQGLGTPSPKAAQAKAWAESQLKK